MKGAPIRFIAAVVGGWACVRVAVLLPGDLPLAIAGDVLASPAAATGRAEVRSTTVAGLPADGSSASATGRVVARTRPGAIGPVATQPRERAQPMAILSTAGPDRPAVTGQSTPSVLVVTSPGLPATPATPRRFGIGAWLLARGGMGGTLSGGMLGGSQAGARLTYAIDPTRRIALSARVAAPLKGRGAEAAIGIDWQPTRAPVHLLAERRFGLDGGGGPTLLAIAGLNPTPVAAGFRLEAYAQGGAIRRGGRTEAFGDGAARLTRPVATIGDTTIDAGAGGWAAGQRGATRIDVGPTIGIAMPVAGRRLRLSADWRERVAGDARPGSGPALSIGTDF